MDKTKDIEEYWKEVHTRHPTHEVIQEFVKPKIEIIRKRVKINPNTSILDVGCGNGWFTWYLSKLSKEVHGIDISGYMIKNNPCKNITFGDAEEIQFDDETFDITFSSNLFHHFTILLNLFLYYI